MGFKQKIKGFFVETQDEQATAVTPTAAPAPETKQEPVKVKKPAPVEAKKSGKPSALSEMFKLGGTISKKHEVIVGIIGAVILMLVWYGVTYTGEIIRPQILPNPVDVLYSYPDLWQNSDLLWNTWYTIKLNLLGYFYALIIAIPVGLVVGLFPVTKALFSKYFDAIRYLPIPAVSGIFIAALGIGFEMKASFLAFGIIIYILPVVVQKIIDLQNPSNSKEYVYLQTIETLGATPWQKFRYVYFPYVMHKISTDIINLTAISYTYIVIAESLNKEGGIGSLISIMSRQSRIDAVYALLFLIIAIGILQDFLLRKLDVAIFPYKYNKPTLWQRIKQAFK